MSLEQERQSFASLIGYLMEMNIKPFCTGPKKFCGSTVPNYPGPSVIMSSSNSVVLSYNLPVDSLIKGHGFQVEKNTQSGHRCTSITQSRWQQVQSIPIVLPHPSSTTTEEVLATHPVEGTCCHLASKTSLNLISFQSAND